MRTITDHKLNGLNDALDIHVLDEPGQGGACHVYKIETQPFDGVETVNCLIQFQNGPIQEFGVNGISGEALLAIVIDRLRCFQAGPYASADNADALSSIESALASLQKRTRERLARGVEGTSQK
jgi:hypothetical protein